MVKEKKRQGKGSKNHLKEDKEITTIESKSIEVISERGMRERKKIKRQRKFLENYRLALGNKTKASKLTGITLDTVIKWQKSSKFLKELEHIEAELIDNAEEKLYIRGIDKSDTALIEYLRVNHPKYKRKTDTAIQINNIVPILQGDTKKTIKATS